MRRLRPTLVLLHRYVGLVLAAFLVLAGLTGAVLPWYHALDAALNPGWLRVQAPAPDAAQLQPLALRARVQAAVPGARVHHVPLRQPPGEAAVFFVGPPAGAPQGPTQVFADPYTGRVLGARRWGDLSEGRANLLPFIYRLHEQLALGTVGTTVFGIVALAWTLDCFVAALLTVPAARRTAGAAPGWWRRWSRAWRVRARASGPVLVFDLHRAGGLWLWAWLFVFAWSSVAFNLPGVYQPVMHTLFGDHAPVSGAPASQAAPEPAMGWDAGLARGRVLMHEQARRHGFTVVEEERLSYRARQGVLHYRVRSNRDLRDRRGVTSVDFDAATGALRAVYIPTGEDAGDTTTSWLLALHMADVGGAAMKVWVCLLGLATAGFSLTGVWIWWRKRRARHFARVRN